MENNMVLLEKPTNKFVDKYVNLFNNDDRYFPADQAIMYLFTAFPENKKIEDILLKVSVINDLYNTNILGTFKMAKHVLSLKIDQDLNDGAPQIVNRIALGHGIRTKDKNTEINFYSFATKYCAWHNPEHFAIFDSFVEKVLIQYKKQDSFCDFKKSDLRCFDTFIKIINEFANFYNIKSQSLKDIDKFLWMYGKKKFPTKF